MGFPRLLSDNVLIEVQPESELKIGSIHLPQMSDDSRGFSKHQEGALCIGTVVAVGPGEKCHIYECRDCRRTRTMLTGEGRKLKLQPCPCGSTKQPEFIAEGSMPMNVAVGDRVVYPHRSGHSVRIENRQYLLMHEEQWIYGLVE